MSTSAGVLLAAWGLGQLAAAAAMCDRAAWLVSSPG
jgi:hypothetical protein